MGKDVNTKKCILHVPNYIDPAGRSGSSKRPVKMLQALKNCGYEVDCVMGYGNERKSSINRIKQRISEGVKYDFLYSESSTMPTLLTEKDHIPRYPFLDFGFLKFCKKKEIRIGLFYRDIQWKFSIYTDNVSWYKQRVSIPLYQYDLKKYEELVDILYLPTSEMAKYLEKDRLTEKVHVLMPGAEINRNLDEEKKIYNFKHRPISILYVGGVDRIYDLKEFFCALKKMAGEAKAVICCRKEEWDSCKNIYIPYLGENIKIIHESGERLIPYYRRADLCCAFAGKGEYMSMAMPVKIFEYLGNLVPVLATKGTVSGRFVEEEDIGWSVEYDEQALEKCLKEIINAPEMLIQKRENQKKILKFHTWEARARQVIQDLT